MYMLLRYSFGVVVEAVALQKGRSRMRVAARGDKDTIELRRSGEQWFTAAGEPVEFDFLMSGDSREQNLSCEKPAYVARHACSAATRW